jgi:hypothetical protein
VNVQLVKVVFIRLVVPGEVVRSLADYAMPRFRCMGVSVGIPQLQSLSSLVPAKVRISGKRCAEKEPVRTAKASRASSPKPVESASRPFSRLSLVSTSRVFAAVRLVWRSKKSKMKGMDEPKYERNTSRKKYVCMRLRGWFG